MCDMKMEIFSDESAKWLPAVTQIKNAVIGSNIQKERAVQQTLVPRLLQFMDDESTPMDLRIESAIVLGSLANGLPSTLQVLVDSGVVQSLLTGIHNSNQKYMEACLRCLRLILCNCPSQVEVIYQNPGVIAELVHIMPRSTCTQECVATIFASCCVTHEHQAKLGSNGAVTALASLLSSNIYRVEMAVLRALAALCYKNHAISKSLANEHTGDGMKVIESLIQRLSRDRTSEMQMSAAKCLAYICRVGVIDASDPVISHKTLSTLVRMCKPDKTWEERVDGAETLGYLTDVNLDLQHIASISDHIISTLAEYFKYPGSPPDASLMPTKKDDIVVGNELRQAAFRAYASLCANNEDVRRKIIETKSIMEHLVNGLSDPVTKVQIAAVRCLHSLSRSVQQLRTNIQDHDVTKPLLQTLLSTNDESLLLVVSAILCNLLLDFSPVKRLFLDDAGVLDTLFRLTHHENTSLRLNAVWALMNVTFHSDQFIKDDVLGKLGNDDLFRLLSDPDVRIVMKTLGLLRNLLSDQSTIDQVMESHGTLVMQAVVLILEGDHNIEVKEQCKNSKLRDPVLDWPELLSWAVNYVRNDVLCILTNVADGLTAKNSIMSNEDVLQKILHYLVQNNVVLQIAAVMCVYNLVRKSDEGYVERQNRLKDMTLHAALQQLNSSTNQDLLDRVKLTLQQF